MDTSLQATSKWQALDTVLAERLHGGHADPERWLLAQTIATATQRRALLEMLDIGDGWNTLDIGTGYGPLAMEIATVARVAAIGIDVDRDVLAAAQEIQTAVAERQGFVAGSRISFDYGNAYALPTDDHGIDLATARFVFQHLDDPASAMAELARVVHRSGLVCVIDVDDGLSVSYPPPSSAYERLAHALTARQDRHGGDRGVGRRLPGLLDQAGFDVVSVLVMPQAAYGSSLPTDLSRALLVERFTLLRSDLIADGGISADEFDHCLGQFAAETTHGICSIESHLAVIGRRR
jgi:SAM-dependent methyltransferase